jgi:hypothetical protein
LTRSDEIKLAVIALLRSKGLEVNVPVSLYEIGAPLVAQGFTEDEILYALYAVKEQGVLDLIQGNRLILRMPL